VDSVIHEMREQARRHSTTNFLFLDLKLNSNPNLLRGIVENVQRNVRGAQWIGTVHVDGRSDNGLSRGELRAAVAAGMRRVSFGLESGSQKMLDAMDKGCTVERNSEFIRTAHEAGLSVRATMFKGYPGETAEDIELTAQFLEKHADYIGRIASTISRSCPVRLLSGPCVPIRPWPPASKSSTPITAMRACATATAQPADAPIAGPRDA
jgi:radical SAM superfamily enzyme YgiQ (UPF0313 family)